MKTELIWPKLWSALPYLGWAKSGILEKIVETDEVKLDENMTMRTDDMLS